MPLPTATGARKPLHHRAISARGYVRDDGGFDIEGHLVDTKSVPFKLASGIREPGDKVHEMWLRITVDRMLTIIDAAASIDAMPYPDNCNQIAPDYKKLIGLSIRPGFTAKVRDLLGGTNGCTHTTELIGIVATTAFQTMAGQGTQPTNQRPFQLGGCHALALTAPAVAKYYPAWYKGNAPLATATPESTKV